ncbi:spermatogenesis-associated protein 19, mitochondrial isoform X1 [Tachyglossus aculeatus]|uniref:spermatogenesis-associated protein 19, mitochondrial isoform X1 n=1 Tax=Tachyglossus aculeatus TaxID=9261 RepID=UPI0018F5884E|nr:spermatogenesis-associated protein 19, mitochondrial isoform X1 [Tachyglossus aculeatus]
MIITTWIIYILIRKRLGYPFPPQISPDVEVVESEALTVVQHWLRKAEEEASQIIKKKLSSDSPAQTRDAHVSRDGMGGHMSKDGQEVKHHTSKSNMVAAQSREVLEERTRIQFIRWSHTRIFQAPGEPKEQVRSSHTHVIPVPSEARDQAMRERIEQVRRSVSHMMVEAVVPDTRTSIRAPFSDC